MRERNQQVNKFGTSDNFQTGVYNINSSNGKINKGYDQRTDGFKALRRDPHANATGEVSRSPRNGFRSEPSEDDYEDDIEEDIVMSNNESPMINAKTKQVNGKAKALFP